MARLFVAIELPDEVKASLACLQQGLRGARWVARDNLHLTLRFIGEVDGATADDIEADLSAVRAKPFSLALAEAGAFPLRGSPRLLWAGVAKTPALDELKRRIDRALTGAGLAPEKRKFAAHITLARLKDAPRLKVGQVVAQIAPAVGGAFEVRDFVLFQSFLSRAGAIYRPEARYPLDAF